MSSQKRKSEVVPKRSNLKIDDNLFDDEALLLSNYTELIEACDWDEELATNIIEVSFDKLIDVASVAILDEAIISSPDSMENLLKLNIQDIIPDITETQFTAIKQIIVSHLKIHAKKKLAIAELTN